MPYDAQQELKRVKDYYAGDPLQQRFSCLLCGGIGAGKTYLARTCRFPIHIDSFDPGGTKSVRDLIKTGDIVADTRWEMEDPSDPDKFADWMKATEVRLQIGYFNNFGTYILDSATTWGDAVMNNVLKAAGRPGESPRHNHDYMPQKVMMTKYIRRLMNLKCDFIMTGHLREIEEVLHIDSKTGIVTKKVEYRFFTTGQAVLTIPLLFDEIYVIVTDGENKEGPKRKMLIDAQGKYIARSRLKANGKLNSEEPPDIKAILKKIGMSTEDKPRLQLT